MIRRAVLSTERPLRALDGLAAGLTSIGMLLAPTGQPAVRVRAFRERSRRSDLDALRGDMTRIGDAFRAALGQEPT